MIIMTNYKKKTLFLGFIIHHGGVGDNTGYCGRFSSLCRCARCIPEPSQSPSDMAAACVPFRHHVMNDNVTGDSRRSHRWDVKPGGHQVFPLPAQNHSFLLKKKKPQSSSG